MNLQLLYTTVFFFFLHLFLLYIMNPSIRSHYLTLKKKFTLHFN